MEIFDFNLDENDLAAIAKQPQKTLLNHHDPEIIKWLNEREIGTIFAR